MNRKLLLGFAALLIAASQPARATTRIGYDTAAFAAKFNAAVSVSKDDNGTNYTSTEDYVVDELSVDTRDADIDVSNTESDYYFNQFVGEAHGTVINHKSGQWQGHPYTTGYLTFIDADSGVKMACYLRYIIVDKHTVFTLMESAPEADISPDEWKAFSQSLVIK